MSKWNLRQGASFPSSPRLAPDCHEAERKYRCGSLIISWLIAMNNGPHLSFAHTFSSSVNSLMKDLGRGERRGTKKKKKERNRRPRQPFFGSFGQTSPKDPSRRHLCQGESPPEHNAGAAAAVFFLCRLGVVTRADALPPPRVVSYRTIKILVYIII